MTPAERDAAPAPRLASRPTASFPRQQARTRRFSLGIPRSFTVAADGSRVLFVRSGAGDDPVGSLWALDRDSRRERCVADPRRLVGDVEAAEADLPPEERARRERAREAAGGVVAYATDRDCRVATFTLGGQAFVADVLAGDARPLGVAGPVVDPRPSPDGRQVAFVRSGALHVVGVDGAGERQLAGEPAADVTWGLAEFVAAEEMDRERGFWWSPDSRRLLAARVDTAAVPRWHIADPADPPQPPATLAYPAAGAANAAVTLALFDLDGRRSAVPWDRGGDRGGFEYLADAVWLPHGPLTLVVQSRDQRRLAFLAVDGDGTTSVVAEQADPHWVNLVAGVPRWLPGGRLVHTVERDDTRRLAVDGQLRTPPGLQVRGLVAAEPERLVFTASGDDPTAVALWAVHPDRGQARQLTADGVAAAVAAAGVTVVVQHALDDPHPRVTVRRAAGPSGGTPVRSHAETPVLRAAPRLLRLGARDLRAALLLPGGAPPGAVDGPLPVLLDPYGGPHAQRVVRSQRAFLESQWLADQGFAVLVADGRGTPGRGPAWERAVAGDLASAPLDDQVAALHGCAEAFPGLLDLQRVAIRGWSFGGFLAVLAVLRRPDVFAAAIAGAPVTDWSLYDTHYTERYLGRPQDAPQAYRRCSLLDDAPGLTRPLLLIHGLADDNVVAAHTLRLSAALLAAGRPHSVLPLPGVTHMTPQEEVAANLLLLQVAFLRDALGLNVSGTDGQPEAP